MKVFHQLVNDPDAACWFGGWLHAWQPNHGQAKKIWILLQSRCPGVNMLRWYLKLSYSLFSVPCSETASTLPFSLTGAVPVVSIYRLNTNNFISIRWRCGLQCHNGSPSIFLYDTLSEKKKNLILTSLTDIKTCITHINTAPLPFFSDIELIQHYLSQWCLWLFIAVTAGGPSVFFCLSVPLSLSLSLSLKRITDNFSLACLTMAQKKCLQCRRLDKDIFLVFAHALNFVVGGSIRAIPDLVEELGNAVPLSPFFHYSTKVTENCRQFKSSWRQWETSWFSQSVCLLWQKCPTCPSSSAATKKRTLERYWHLG